MVNPKLWGSHAWKFLHYVTLDYPENPTYHDKEKYKKFFLSLQGILPCLKCKDHLKSNLKILPLSNKVLASDKNLMYWLIDLHNVVNESTGAYIIDRDKAFELLYYKAKIIDSKEPFKAINDLSTISSPNTIKINTKKNKSNNNHYYLFCLIPIIIFGFLLTQQLKKISKQK